MFLRIIILTKWRLRSNLTHRMNTKRTFLYWAGLLIGILVSVAVAVAPSIIYALTWWYIPKTPVWIVTVLIGGGSMWIIAQFSLPLMVSVWRYNSKKGAETFWEGIGRPSSVVLFTLLGFLPTALYATLWWLIPKKLGFMYLCVIPGISIWFIAQVVWIQNVIAWWKRVYNFEEENFDSLPSK